MISSPGAPTEMKLTIGVQVYIIVIGSCREAVLKSSSGASTAMVCKRCVYSCGSRPRSTPSPSSDFQAANHIDLHGSRKNQEIGSPHKLGCVEQHSLEVRLGLDTITIYRNYPSIRSSRQAILIKRSIECDGSWHRGGILREPRTCLRIAV